MLSIALALAVSLSGGPPAQSAPGAWRVINDPALHLGIRPAALVTPDERAVGVTVQVSIFAL